MNQYYEINNISFVNLTAEQCSLTDPQCTAVNVPLYDEVNRRNETCLDDTFTASSCCSLHNNAFLTNSSSLEKNDWRRYLTDLIDGTVSEPSLTSLINSSVDSLRLHSGHVRCQSIVSRLLPKHHLPGRQPIVRPEVQHGLGRLSDHLRVSPTDRHCYPSKVTISRQSSTEVQFTLSLSSQVRR